MADKTMKTQKMILTLLINIGRASYVAPDVVVTSLRQSPLASLVNGIWQGIFAVRNGDETTIDQRKIFCRTYHFSGPSLLLHPCPVATMYGRGFKRLTGEEEKKTWQTKESTHIGGHPAELRPPYLAVVWKFCFMLPLQ